MKYRVTRSFSTPLRRFAVGMEISAAEVDGPLSAAQRLAMGELALVPAVQAPPAPSAAAEAIAAEVEHLAVEEHVSEAQATAEVEQAAEHPSEHAG